MDDDVGAQIERTAQNRRCKRIVDNEQHAVLFTDRGDLIEVEYDDRGVGDRFAEDELRLVIDERRREFAFVGIYRLIDMGTTTFNCTGDVVTARATRTISTGFWVLAVLQFFGVLSDLVDFMQATSLPIGGGKVTIWTVFVAAVTLCITLLVANWAAGRVDQIIHRSQSLSANLRVALSRVVRILLYVVAVIIGLNSVGVDLSILSVFGGAMGVGIGFGLQKIASNYISGFIILLDRSIKIGDLVNVAGFRGRITEINIRYTVVRNSDGVECIVPNENFVTSTVQNFSYTETDSVSYVDISVAYDADVKRALEIMLEEGMRERPRIAKGKRGWAYLESFGDSGINLRLAFWVKDPVNGTVGLKTAISLAVYERFQKEGIEVPFNRLDVNILPRAEEAAAGATS